MQLIYLETELYVENANLNHLIKNIYKIHDNYKIPGYCFIIKKYDDADKRVDSIISDVYSLIQMFCTKNIPHNVFFTSGTYENSSVIRVYIYPRQHYYETKENCTFNVAFCELSGYVPVGSAEMYDTVTDKFIIEKFAENLGDLSTIENEILMHFN